MSSALKSEFKAVLDQSDLASIPRDLRFHPTVNDHPAVLTADQIRQFNEQGYIRGLRAFDDEVIATIREYFDNLLARVIASGGDSYSISSAHLKYGRVWDILREQRIVAAVNDLIGPNVIGWGSGLLHDQVTVSVTRPDWPVWS